MCRKDAFSCLFSEISASGNESGTMTSPILPKLMELAQTQKTPKGNTDVHIGGHVQMRTHVPCILLTALGLHSGMHMSILIISIHNVKRFCL